MMWVACAGPSSNMVLAIASALVLKFSGPGLNNSYFYPLSYMLNIMVMINVGLAIFNLIPIPPLDGGRIIVGLLPKDMAYKWARIEPYGFIILLALIFTGMIQVVLFPAIHGIVNVLLAI